MAKSDPLQLMSTVISKYYNSTQNISSELVLQRISQMKSQTVLVVPWDIELSLSVDDSFNPLNNTLPIPQNVFRKSNAQLTSANVPMPCF